jgi:hypothetical protein
MWRRISPRPRVLAVTLQQTSPFSRPAQHQKHVVLIATYHLFPAEILSNLQFLQLKRQSQKANINGRGSVTTSNTFSQQVNHGCLSEVLGHCQGPVAYQMDMSFVIVSRHSTHSLNHLESPMYAFPFYSKQPHKHKYTNP